jgi:hypothetical protein
MKLWTNVLEETAAFIERIQSRNIATSDSTWHLLAFYTNYIVKKHLGISSLHIKSLGSSNLFAHDRKAALT